MKTVYAIIKTHFDTSRGFYNPLNIGYIHVIHTDEALAAADMETLENQMWRHNLRLATYCQDENLDFILRVDRREFIEYIRNSLGIKNIGANDLFEFIVPENITDTELAVLKSKLTLRFFFIQTSKLSTNGERLAPPKPKGDTPDEAIVWQTSVRQQVRVKHSSEEVLITPAVEEPVAVRRPTVAFRIRDNNV